MKRSVISLTLLSLLTQVIAFGKSVLMGQIFGISVELDGYYLAQVIPALINAVILGAIQSGFVPVYMKLRENSEEALHLRSAILRKLVVILAFATLAAMVLTPWIVGLIAPGAEELVKENAIRCYRVIALAMSINLVADYLGLVLNAEMNFGVVALAASFNVLAATLLLVMWPEWGLDVLLWGLMLGAGLQLLVNYLRLVAMGKGFIARPAVHPLLGEAGRIGVKILPGLVFSNLSASIPQIAVATLGAGAISTYGYGSRFHGVFVQTLVMGTSTILLSHFAVHAANKSHRELAEMLRRAFVPLMLLSMVALLWVHLTGQSALRILFESGKMTGDDIGSIYEVWLVLTAALPVIFWGIFSAKVLQAMGHTGQLSVLALIGVVATSVAAWLGMGWGVGGVAGAVGVGYSIVTILTYREAKRALSGPILQLSDWTVTVWIVVVMLGIAFVGSIALETRGASDIFRVVTNTLVAIILIGLGYRLHIVRGIHESR